MVNDAGLPFLPCNASVVFIWLYVRIIHMWIEFFLFKLEGITRNNNNEPYIQQNMKADPHVLVLQRIRVTNS